MDERVTGTPLLGGPGTFPALLILAATIQYLCVPETDHYSNVVALLIGFGFIESFTSSTYPASRGAALYVVAWAGWFGASGRESAEVGALVSAWPVLVGILMLQRHRRGKATRVDVVVVVACCLAAGLAVARTGALADDPEPAYTAAAVALSASAIVGATLVLLRRTRGIAAFTPDSRNDSLGAS